MEAEDDYGVLLAGRVPEGALTGVGDDNNYVPGPLLAR